MEEDSQWLAWNQIFRGRDGVMQVTKRPVNAEWLPDAPLEHPKRWLAWEHPKGGM